MTTTRNFSLAKLSDSELINRLATLRRKERKTTLEILLHLNEVERRKLHLSKGYGSLFDYCTKKLRYSESAANRRIRTARCIRDVPEVYELVEKGRLNLATVSLISGTLTEENKSKLLKEICGKSYREVERIVSRYRPVSVVRDRIKPIHVLKSVPKMEQQKEMGKDSSVKHSGLQGVNNVTAGAGGKNLTNVENSTPNGSSINLNEGFHKASNTQYEQTIEQRYKFEFSVSEQFMKKFQQVQKLISNGKFHVYECESIFDKLMDAYLDRHSPEKRIERRENRKLRMKSTAEGQAKNGKPEMVKTIEKQEKRKIVEKPNTLNNRKTPLKQESSTMHPATPKKRSRHIPAAVRDKVYSRDGGRCTFIGSDGVRCGSTRNLQLDHIVPFCNGGDSSVRNLRLLCAQHNLLAADMEFGKAFMEPYYRRE